MEKNEPEVFLKVFDDAIILQNNDIALWHYKILGYHSLSKADSLSKTILTEMCKVITSTLSSKTATLTDYYHASSAFTYLSMYKTNCKITNMNLAQSVAEAVVSANNATAEKLFYALKVLHNLSVKIDSKKVYTHVKELLKKDSSAFVQSFIFQIVPLLDLTKDMLKVHFNDIEDVLLQADETDHHLFFDNGVFTTATIVTGVSQVLRQYGAFAKIENDKMLKLTSFLLSRRFAKQPKVLSSVLLALAAIGTNKFLIPITYNLPNVVKSGLTNKENLPINICNIFGHSIPSTVTPIELSHLGDKRKIEINKSPLRLKDNLNIMSLADLNLVAGSYQLTVAVKPNDSKTKYMGGEKITVLFSVVDNLQVSQAMIKVSDQDHQSHIQKSVIKSVGQKHEVKDLTAYSQQILSISVTIIKTTADSKFIPQQVFLRMTNIGDNSEILFVAQVPKGSSVVAMNDKDMEFVAHVDLQKSAKDFAYSSGAYRMQLIIGDRFYNKGGIQWYLGDINMYFITAPPVNPAVGSAKVHFADAPKLVGDSKPEIEHLFRLPERRAPSIIVYVFTILCIVPFFVMIALWFSLGVNLQRLMDSQIFGILFHLCLTSIFGIYFMYWLKWNMFVTLKYLAILSVPTFLFGHRMLCKINSQRLKSSTKKKGD